ncbi:uncharacterized protein BKCO1_4800046 [Diplodia corticola]|uniref:Uncharacterized protein n=1 Tax=Diplodia corticola TaxID=236234 RepID=A0A1J9QST7_9PEZI|nr:uncharacterized protein BKCO1_4800046 [Diplodia corticola]OJD31465.1 hypothetical protein BKCO1_4800046 [Diplodia corticola]
MRLQPEQIEISDYPLSAAIDKLGGDDVLLSSIDLNISVVKFPKEPPNASEEEKRKVMNRRFVSGVSGRVPLGYRPRNKKKGSTAKPGDPWEIRWDWDEGKGAHVNLVCGSGNRTKFAFKMRTRIRSGYDTYIEVIRQMSAHVGYNTLPGPPAAQDTPEGRLRTDRNRNAPLTEQMKKKLLEGAAKSLIKKWISELGPRARL